MEHSPNIITHLLTLRDSVGNQFRALEEDEVVFLDSIKADKDKEERKRKVEDDEEVLGFKA